jgi:hypothetical protein
VAGVDTDVFLVVGGSSTGDDVWTNVTSAARAKEMSEYQLSIPNITNMIVANTGPVPPPAAIPKADDE